MVETRIIPSKPALILEGETKNLVVTDLHIGFEANLASNFPDDHTMVLFIFVFLEIVECHCSFGRCQKKNNKE